MLSLLSLVMVLLCVHCNGAAEQPSGRYDKNVNLFSSNGELMQVQYARNAGLKGAPILCSHAVNGDVILCVPTPADIQTLQDRRSVDKVAQIGDGMWFAFSGLAGDGRALLKYARSFCIDYQGKFGSTPSVRSVARMLGEVQHESTLTGGKRPYGVQVILIGVDDSGDGLSIYSSEPSGETAHWKAVAIGQNSGSHMKQLEARWRSDMTTADVVKLLVDIAGVNTADDTATVSPDGNSEQYSGPEGSVDHSSSKNTVVDLYRFSRRIAEAGNNRKFGTVGYHMQYYRSPEELARGL